MLGDAPLFTHDISAGGFCAELMNVKKPGTLLQGRINLEKREFPFAGQVRWALQGDLHLNKRGRMGVQFTHIPDDFVQLVEALIQCPPGASPEG